MKKAKSDSMRAEYRREDLGKGMRGKYSKEFKKGSNLVLLKPEVAAVFRTDQAVNEALMSLLNVARRLARKGA